MVELDLYILYIYNNFYQRLFLFFISKDFTVWFYKYIANAKCMCVSDLWEVEKFLYQSEDFFMQIDVTGLLIDALKMSRISFGKFFTLLLYIIEKQFIMDFFVNFDVYVSNWWFKWKKIILESRAKTKLVPILSILIEELKSWRIILFKKVTSISHQFDSKNGFFQFQKNFRVPNFGVEYIFLAFCYNWFFGVIFEQNKLILMFLEHFCSKVNANTLQVIFVVKLERIWNNFFTWALRGTKLLSNCAFFKIKLPILHLVRKKINSFFKIF